MTEFSFERDRQARFGLADVGDAVRDYCDLLLDNAKEFIAMNREEMLKCGRENAELAEKLAAGGLEPSEREAVSENMFRNVGRIGEIKKFLDGDYTMSVAIDLAGDVLRDSEPELADRFNAASVAEKYACLVEHYMDEYRNDFQIPAGTVSLTDDDAFRFAEEMVGELFPKIAEQYGKHKREEYKKLLKDDPIKIYDGLVEKYSAEYVDDAGERLSGVKKDRDALQSRLLEHDGARPGWLKNLTTLGNAGKAWAGERDALAREIAGHENQMAELQKIGEDGKNARLPESARRGVESMILSRHPEVVEARERYMARRWEEVNAARLEKQRERQVGRDDGNEQARDNGISR